MLRSILGYAAHAYTALGIVTGLWCAIAIFGEGNYRLAFFWMLVGVLVDSSDGTVARWAQVKVRTPQIDGRTLDDIVDYVNYTLLPMLLVWHAGWFPYPAGLWAAIPLVTSLFAFAHTGAKDEAGGFFLGFPSYWNIVVFYLAVLEPCLNEYVVLAVLLGLSLLSVMPVRFVYPNRAPRWKSVFLGGALVWLVILLAMLYRFPHVPLWVTCISCVYPLGYTALSLYLHIRGRRLAAHAVSTIKT